MSSGSGIRIPRGKLGVDPGNNRGLYVSSDAGLTWRFATVKDAGTSITSSSVTSVVSTQTLRNSSLNAAWLLLILGRFHLDQTDEPARN